MFPETLYMSGLGKAAYLFAYFPLSLVLIWLFYRKFKSHKPLFIALTFILTLLPWWDVYLVSRHAEELCSEQGGLHSYRTVETEGFWGGGGDDYWTNYGFLFVESGGGDNKSHYILIDGKATYKKVNEFESQYFVFTGDNHKKITNNIFRSSMQVVEISSNNILGELVSFNIYPGTFDSFVISSLPVSSVVWHCGDENMSGEKYSYRDLVKSTLLPKHGSQ